ncbi:thioesterase family protein [Halopseudomonas yangmingensis]|uniref:Uncharacterized domain 1-containing protein n=1 Tax=Halopseudomonas yangmingensis TaxID=1720063 RepID=A0A1I4RPU2_9GAMM|nr:thioesterase family protein [Halopseudomonas yangmingensis]SFM54204.1 uncharacterized domain 1-containing protein [Halopseudomonas yangmingensis]
MAEIDTSLPADLEKLVHSFFDRIPFNLLLGIRIDSLASDKVHMSLPMREDLIGNYYRGILHGGAISALIDVCGGAMAMIGAWEKQQDLPASERMQRLSKLGTIDLRVDYLSPGKGQLFTCDSSLLRIGNKVAVVRSHLHSDSGALVAAGTGTYLCG